MKLLNIKFLFLFLSTFASGQKNDWKFIKETEGIKVYFRESEGGGIKEVKMITLFDAKLSSVIECLKDVEAYPKWVYKATYSTTLFRYSNNDVVYYNYIDFPWPMQDRDIAVQSIITQDPTTRIITSRSFAKWDAKPMQKDIIRIQDFKSTWTLKPNSSGKVEGEYVFRSNPGGSIPTWAVNLGLDEGPLKTLKGLKKLIKEPKYQNPNNGFLD